MINTNVRKAIADNKLKLWQVAEQIGLNDGNFSRLLRREIQEPWRSKIFEAIKKLSKEVGT